MKSFLNRPARPHRLRRTRDSRRLASFALESLETRQMMTVGITTATPIPAALFTPTSTNLFDAQNGPMAMFGTNLVSVYKTYATDFVAAAASSDTSSAAASLATKIEGQFPSMQISGSSVNMSINSLGGDFNAFVTQLTNLGVQVTNSDASYGIVEGMVPIAQLPAIAKLPQTEAGHAIMAASTHSLTGFQGIAYNEPETTLQADAARSQFVAPNGASLDGTGVTVGVLSDSVNQVKGGLQASYNTGDLDPNHPVNVIKDGNSGNSDEGRAMLEGIHDIAPGASLQFASGGPGDLGFMESIIALYNAGSKVIVDDLSQSDEPFFQDGLIAQGVDYVTARGDAYFTSAANSGDDNGYLSTFRPITATVGSVAAGTTNSGTFQDFNTDGNIADDTALLKITTGVDNSFINFQYDQPFKTQEPTGATAAPTSAMYIYVYDGSGDLVVAGTDNNLKTMQPYQGISVPSKGTYYVAIKLVSGTNPGHVEFVGLGDSGAVQVDKSHGAAGGTYYPSSEGHETTVAAIGVGATAWYQAAPFENTGIATPTETSSSTGPGLIVLSPKGTPITPTLVQNPAITSADGGTTSFFGQAGINTTLYGGSPAFDDTPVNQQKLYDFFGTSQAAPNAAAVAALMYQAVPTLNRVQLLQAMERTATPINNTPQGTYNIQSGYGLLNAVAAINAIKAPTGTATTTTASTPTTSPATNQPLTLTANVSSGGGSVDFYDISYNTDLGSIPLSGGTASLTYSPAVSGAHIYLLTYGGDSANATSSAYLVLNVAGSSNFVTHSAVIRPIARPTSQPVPITLGMVIPTFTDPQTTGDATTGLALPATGGTTARAKKFTI